MTEAQIKKLCTGETLWDKEIKGLHVRALATKKSFYYFYRTQSGIQRKPRIGGFPSISVSEARTVAKEMAVQVAKGMDPSKNRKLSRLEPTLYELFDSCMKFYWDLDRFKKSGWAKEVSRLFHANIAEQFGSKKISDISQIDVALWHDKMRSRPYEANRSLAVFSRLFNWAKETGREIENPCRHVKAHPEQKRSRYGTQEEMSKIGNILRREAFRFPAEVAYIYLLIYTGSRPRAIERVTADQLEPLITDDGTVFGRFKFIGKDGWEEVLLPPQVVELIPSEPFNLSRIRTFWDMVKQEAGCKDLRLRDLRRTFASLALSSGQTMDKIGELLNHKSAQTTKTYARLLGRDKEKSAVKVAQSIEEILA